MEKHENRAPPDEVHGRRARLGRGLGADRFARRLLVPLAQANPVRRRLAQRRPLVALFACWREPVSGRDGHLTRFVNRAAARSDLDVLARPVVVFAGFVEGLVSHLLSDVRIVHLSARYIG